MGSPANDWVGRGADQYERVLSASKHDFRSQRRAVDAGRERGNFGHQAVRVAFQQRRGPLIHPQ